MADSAPFGVYVGSKGTRPMASPKGFKAVASSIAKRGGYSKKAAGAILASASRNASPAAKRRNPRLKRVK
jgi:hypothetical protein